ncbi:HNH endonuclease [Phaeobacter gallaeciensis]|uniref:HNH endonuclease n=1 Tax=Phaeobacter gallaeciensis TaxID=60890 RepID=UPI00237F58F7|nr:HNH endonuclease [Phaeobacter gallaeciensis]MDE4099103.1 HNH endonuclease [Phaeobacter gallaeciensis]MDE4108031.1 HNH endonuclease [Phaeobacter gallaeciensis]MDE4112367.1 HNH endonuclease [Phaeobacter gallaeciensis]MDE4116956.1 HNH endonuclease [Phaeobacter gallaeciensis]MDE4121309.1 HNH endonuclease [Phaeobacter gallaeciensis]
MTKIKKNPDWTLDELLVALDYYLDNRGDYFPPSGKGVKELSNKIRMVAASMGLVGLETMRNTDGVSRKLLNIRLYDPLYETGASTHVSKLDKVVWNEYAHRPSELKKVVAKILELSQASFAGKAPILPGEDGMEIEANEGRLLSRFHRYRERDRSIIKRKKAAFLKKEGHLYCEACGFDFSKTYGPRGDGFIECHHTKPVSELETGETTKIADLVLLCANCHRMVHASRPWWTMEELRETLKST